MSISNKVRFEVLMRDNFRCQYCGRHGEGVTLEVDHIDPRANGGSDDPGNLITACWECNNGKRADPVLSASEMGKCIPQGPGCDGDIKYHLCAGCLEFAEADAHAEGVVIGRDEGYGAALRGMFRSLVEQAKLMRVTATLLAAVLEAIPELDTIAPIEQQKNQEEQRDDNSGSEKKYWE